MLFALCNAVTRTNRAPTPTRTPKAARKSYTGEVLPELIPLGDRTRFLFYLFGNQLVELLISAQTLLKRHLSALGIAGLSPIESVSQHHKQLNLPIH
ncbi:hypothetical protein CC2G_007239 [Coprinopsis cinerea AmutBmut pab1-1]|nr:hypothetical protein CC2G_007239 [Coprinopsis cinerea AmutBmut pab1-1]